MHLNPNVYLVEKNWLRGLPFWLACEWQAAAAAHHNQDPEALQFLPIVIAPW